MSKIEKTIARQKDRIQEGQFYEAHQQLRVIAARYIKSSNWNAAIDILFNGSQLLLQAGQSGSGSDLAMYLMEVYNKAELVPDAASKGRLLTILRAFPDDPSRKRFIGEIVGWSSRHGAYPAGDPDLHHVAGNLLASSASGPDAERHLLLGTRDSPPLLARLEYAWYASAAEPPAAPVFAARAVLPYLLLNNVRAARQAHLLFAGALCADNPNLGTQEVGETRIFTGVPLMNFLTLLLLAVQRGAPELYRVLRSHYAEDLRETDWAEPLEAIAEMYFGIAKPKNSNPLMDMMAGMFGGGGGGAPAQTRRPGIGAAPTAAPGVD